MRVEASQPGTSTVCAIFRANAYKKLFYLENEGQGHRAQHSQWCNLMENINLGKSHMMHFCDSSHYFRDNNISIL